MRRCQTVHITACGSGNFLVIAYKELRRLEHAILERLAEIDTKHVVLYAESRISIENFYGIEIDDFAVEVAILSLWIAKHQMNSEFKDKFGVSIPLIPLKETGKIRAGNATRIDWNEVCPNDGQSEIYLISNPPYVGSSMQTAEQKSDFEPVFGMRPYSRNLDYISLWFVRGSYYIAGTRAELAFVTTNSITQGEQVALLFPSIFDAGIEISFAYTSFKWENNAKRNAGVTVAVIGLRQASAAPKYIFTDGVQMKAKNINGYLADADSVFIGARRRPLAEDLPPMSYGSKPTDGGHLVLSTSEERDLERHAFRAKAFVRKYVGSSEFIKGHERYCLWIEEQQLPAAMQIPEIARRISNVASMRQQSKKVATQKLALTPHKFGELRYKPTESIIVPSVSSERREYIPIGYLGPDTIISNAAFAIYDAEPWLFALLTSRMHMVWTRAVGGQLETRLRYSNTIVYYNFPVPPLSDEVKDELTVAALRVLDVREYHCERTLAELYDPDKMPEDLRQAHAEVDALVVSIYSKREYETDEERLSDLFAMYEEMTAAERAKKPAKRGKN